MRFEVLVSGPGGPLPAVTGYREIEDKEMPMSNILAKHEMLTLKGMNVYWEEVLKRDNQEERQHIASFELTQVILTIGAEKVLQIIAEYVENVSD